MKHVFCIPGFSRSFFHWFSIQVLNIGHASAVVVVLAIREKLFWKQRITCEQKLRHTKSETKETVKAQTTRSVFKKLKCGS